MDKQEEMALRELAAKPHYLPQVAAAIGPLSLWSKNGLEREIRKAVEEKRLWVGLSEDELLQIGVATGLERAAAQMISAKLKEKNHD
jgi:hypothetical protein